MLHFFRKIRQKLLAEGKLKSYTLYAIGEIFLAVLRLRLASPSNTRELEPSSKTVDGSGIAVITLSRKMSVVPISSVRKF